MISRPPGYVLQVDPDDLDARRFAPLLQEGGACSIEIRRLMPPSVGFGGLAGGADLSRP